MSNSRNVSSVSTVSSGKGKKDVTIEDLSAQIETLKNDIATLTGSLSNYGKATTEEAKQKAKETISDLGAAGREKAHDAQSQAEEFIRTQPATALGIATGIGFLIGLLMSRR